MYLEPRAVVRAYKWFIQFVYPNITQPLRPPQKKTTISNFEQIYKMNFDVLFNYAVRDPVFKIHILDLYRRKNGFFF